MVFSSIIPAIEARRGVALVSESFAYSAGNRVRLLRLTPEPIPSIVGTPRLRAHFPPQRRSFGNVPSKLRWQYRDCSSSIEKRMRYFGS